MNFRNSIQDFNEFFLNNEEFNDEILFELDSIHCKLDILAKHLYEQETITGEEFIKYLDC